MSSTYSSYLQPAGPSQYNTGTTQRSVLQVTGNPQPTTVNPQGGAAPGGTSVYSWNSPQVKSAVTANPTPVYTAPVDPYAKWGGKAGYDGMQAGWDQTLGSINNQADFDTRSYASKYGLSINELVNQGQVGQSAIDTSRINNFANQQLGQKQVNNMVGSGIQSGGVLLANRNAGDSSATEAIAKAYGVLGNREMMNINNQFEAGQRDINQAQVEFDAQQALGLNRLKVESADEADRIVTQARDDIAALRAEQQKVDFPTQVDIEAEIAAIQGRTIASLKVLDNRLVTEMGAIKGIDNTTAQSKAMSNINAGNVPQNQFNYNTSPEVKMPGASPPSTLPIYTNRNSTKKEV